ncbi:hypothetical protein AUP07_0408 [methanogenic archaeon mixed culture ISO4-G1]|nr:hypothetical protein AUP07_0408 [methanogenic archaeon mixed culture ISO4-G1]
MTAEASRKIKTVFETIGITVMFLAEMLLVSRPTIYRYFDWFDSNLREKIPEHVLGLFDLAMSDKGTKQTVLNHLDYLHKDLLNKRKVVITKSGGLVNEPVDPYHSGLENFVPKVPGMYLSDGSVVSDSTDKVDPNARNTISTVLSLRRKIDDAMKSYISDSFSDDYFYYSFPDHAYVTSFYPPQFAKGRSTDYFFLYNYLDMIRDLLTDELVTKCDVKFVAELSTQIDKAMSYLEYLSNNADPYDDDAYNKVVKELNRPTFDITLNKRWFVCVYVVVLVDEYPDESTSGPYMNMVEAVGIDDAWAVSQEQYSKDVKGFTTYDKRIFGPFKTKDECRKVYDYLNMDWDSMYSSVAPYDVVIEWLEAQTKKNNLNWGGE